MDEEAQNGGAVLAQGNLNMLREIQQSLSKQGIQGEIVKPPGYTGKG